MTAPARFERSLVTPHPQSVAFAGTLPMPLTELFNQRYGPIPPIKEVRDQLGAWRTVGQTRTIALVGGTMRETLTSVDEPHSFGYILTDLTGPMTLLARQIEGEWLFAPTEAGTAITWRWTVQPRSAPSDAAMPVFGRLWQGYAARALARLNDLLDAGTNP